MAASRESLRSVAAAATWVGRVVLVHTVAPVVVGTFLTLVARRR